MNEPKLEVWMRGPVDGITPLLQPVAHALLQAREEVIVLLKNFPNDKLWIKPADMASTGFHLKHLSGVLDRLFTYARNESLTPEQFSYLQEEGTPTEVSTHNLVEAFSTQVDRAMDQLKNTDIEILLEPRTIGRKKNPTNVLGLLFHAAEHTQRHVGQLLVTAKVVLKS